MKIFQFLLIFAAFPTLIFGIKCAAGGICYDEKESGLLVDVPIKTCKDACVYFKCSGDSEIKEGIGCLEDFLNVCKYTPTKTKDEIRNNIKKYSIENEDLVFKSCSDKNECTTNGLTAWTTDNVEFNIGPAYRSYNNTCKYIENNIHVHSNNTDCSRRLKCRPGKLFFATDVIDDNIFWFVNNVYGVKKECDACLEFKCSNDGGNTVIDGSGCWDDFVHACPSISSDVKENIKKNINDSFYFGKNYIVTSCSSTTFFHKCNSLSRYGRFNSLAEKTFNANVNKTFDRICHIGFADPPPPTSTLPQESSGQASAFKFNEIVTVFFVLLAVIYFL